MDQDTETQANKEEIQVNSPICQKVAISFAELMLGNVDRFAEYESIMMIRISEFISMTQKTRSESDETKKLLDFLNILLKAYSFAQKFTKGLRVELVLKLKEEYDRGFEFI